MRPDRLANNLRQVGGGGAVLALFAVLVVIMTYPHVHHLRSGVSDLGDPLLSTWRLAWIAHQLPRDPLHLFDANIFYPERRTLAYSDSMIVPSVMVAPLVWCGMHPLLAYNLLFLSGFVFSGAAMVLLVWSLTRCLGAALFAGIVFMFHPYRYEHYAHLELQMTQWMPLGLWALHRTIREGRLRDGLLTGAFLALQAWSSLYYGIFFASCLVPIAGTLLLGRGQPRDLKSSILDLVLARALPPWSRRILLPLYGLTLFYVGLALIASLTGGVTVAFQGVVLSAHSVRKMLRIAAGIFLVALIVRISVGTVQRLFGEVRVTLAGRQPLGYGSPVVALVAGAALAAVLVVPLTLPYFVNREVLGDRSRDEIRYYSAEPRDYLVAHERNALYGPLTAHRGKPERQLLQGILLPVLAVVGMWPPLSVARIAYVFALLFAFEASLGFNGYVFDWLYSYVVAYKGLRVPSRFAILVGLSLAVLAGFGVARLRAMVPRRWSPFVAAGLALIVLFEYRSIIKLEMVWTDPPPVYERFIGQPQSVLIEFPVFIPGGVHETKYMYFSTFHWQTLVNGYSGFGPPSYYRTLEAIRNFPDDSSLTYLQRLGVDYAIVHGAFYDPAVYADLVSRLDERTDVLLVESYRWMKAESRLYRISQRPSGS